MSWRSAFLLQAQSDNRVRRAINSGHIEYAHQLHYLQMATEKLAKGFATPEAEVYPPAKVHHAFVRFLHALKRRQDIQHQLGYPKSDSFTWFVKSVLPLAEKVEHLAPNFAGTTQPNPEYPWQATPAHRVIAPAEFEFPEFDARSPEMARLVWLVDQLLRIVT
jgi:hypothetical protein